MLQTLGLSAPPLVSLTTTTTPANRSNTGTVSSNPLGWFFPQLREGWTLLHIRKLLSPHLRLRGPPCRSLETSLCSSVLSRTCPMIRSCLGVPTLPSLTPQLREMETLPGSPPRTAACRLPPATHWGSHRVHLLFPLHDPYSLLPDFQCSETTGFSSFILISI